MNDLMDLDILRHERLIDTVRKFPSTDGMAMQNLFRKRSMMDTDIASWDEITWDRKRAPLHVRGTPAQRMDLLSRSHRTASVVDIFMSKQLDATQIEYLRRYGSDHGSGAEQIINDEIADMNRLIDYTVEYACSQVLQGSWATDQTSSSHVKAKGVNYTLTFGVSTLSRNASWATIGTPIYTDEFNDIFDEYLDINGTRPGRAWHNRTVMDQILTNTEIKSFMGEQFKTQLLTSGHVNNIRGIDLLPYDFGDKDSGTYAKYLADNTLLFVPPEAEQYNTLFEASAMIPSPDGHSLTRSGPGKYAYAMTSHNPPGIELFLGYRFLPAARYPETILKFTTV